MSDEYPIVKRIWLAQPRRRHYQHAKWIARSYDFGRPTEFLGSSHEPFEPYVYSPLHMEPGELPNKTQGVLAEVGQERAMQDAKWGQQNYDLNKHLTILTEEVGEVAKAICENTFRDGSIADIREELIQVAAVAVAMVERIDRNPVL